MTHNNEQRTTTVPLEISQDQAIDWLIRYHLPNALEAAGYAEDAQPFRDLDAYSGVTERGHIAAWPGLVGRLNELRRRTWDTFSEENDPYFERGSQDPKAVWFRENILHYFSADLDLDQRELRKIGDFAAQNLLPSKAGEKAQDIVQYCRWTIAARHLSEGHFDLPNSLNDLCLRSSDALRQICAPPAEVKVSIPREIIEQIWDIEELLDQRLIGLAPKALRKLLQIVGREDRRPILLDFPIPHHNTDPTSDRALTAEELEAEEEALAELEAWELSEEGRAAERKAKLTEKLQLQRKGEHAEQFEQWAAAQAGHYQASRHRHWRSRQQQIREEVELVEGGAKPANTEERRMLGLVCGRDPHVSLAFLRENSNHSQATRTALRHAIKAVRAEDSEKAEEMIGLALSTAHPAC
ncbi:hypothetical protein ACIFOC_01259 [Leucobacter aridicollis]|uniref:hypothetical protein n=1 Tax=Leucobacter aridicollis TaxID=283878 RepID=UPI0037CC4EC6